MESTNLLKRIIEAIGTNLELNEVLNIICKEVADFFEVDKSVIGHIKYDNNKPTLHSIAECLKDTKIKSHKNIKISKRIINFITKIVLDESKNLIINDMDTADIPDFYRNFQKKLGVKSMIYIPIKKNSNNWGILGIYQSKYSRTWTKKEINLILSIVDFIYIAIRQSELYSSLKQKIYDETAILNNIPFMAWLKDNNSRLLSVNEEFAKNCNTTIENLIGKTDFDFFPKHHASSYVKEDREVMKQKRTIQTQDLIKGSSGVKWHETFKSPVFDDRGNVVGTVGISRDITEQKESEIELYKRQLELKKANERERLLRELISITRSTLDINSVKQLFVEGVAKYIDADRVVFVKFDSENKVFLTVDHFSEHLKDKNSLSFVGYNWMNQEIMPFTKKLIEGKEINFYNLEKYILKNNLINTAIPKLFKKANIFSSYNILIRYQDEIKGFFCIDFSEKRVLKKEELEFIRTLSDQIGVAIFQAELYEKEKLKAKREQFLSNILSKAISTFELEQLTQLVKDIGKFTNADRCYIVEVEQEKFRGKEISPNAEYLSSKKIKSVIGYKFSTEDVKKFVELYLQKKDLIILDYEKIQNENNKDYSQLIGYSRQFGLKSGIGIPFIYVGKLVAVLAIEYVKKKEFPADDAVDFLRILGNQIGIAYNQILLYQNTKNIAKRESLLRKIMLLSLRTLDIKDILNLIVSETAKSIDADRCVYIQYDFKNERYQRVEPYAEYISSPNFKKMSGITYTKEESDVFAEVLIKEKKNFIVPNTNKIILPEAGRKIVDQFEIKSFVLIPVIYENTPIGTFIIHYITRYKDFSDEELEFLNAVAKQSATVINQAMLYQKEKNTAQKEIILREISSELRAYKNINEAFEYLLKKIATIYKVERTILIEVPIKGGEPIVGYEYFSGENSKPTKNVKFPDTFIHIVKNILDTHSNTIILNTKNLCKNCSVVSNFLDIFGVKSFIGYPLIRYNHETKLLGILFICSNKNKDWNEYEIDLLKAINENVVNIIWEILKNIEVNKLRDTFLNTLAHDLQVPVVGTITALDYVCKKSLNQPIGNYRDIILETVENNKRILTILKNLLNSYQYESSKYELKYVKFDIYIQIETILFSFDNLIKSKELNINITKKYQEANIYADLDEVKKVLNIYIENAIYYTQYGGKIVIDVSLTKNQLKVCVSDNGPGIPEGIKDLIFKRYEMAAKIERKIGAGISLYLARQIIESHNGTVSFTSVANKGTTFCFELPKNHN